jgi:hypothetical protein
MKTYFISGIAPDGRIFRHIRLPAGFEAVYLDWIKPQPEESIENYAYRLAEKINKDEPKVKHYLTRENQDDKKIIIKMISETDPDFIKWGIRAVLKWRNKRIPKSIYHIHGTRDEVFPYRFTSPTHTIIKGDHTLVNTRYEEVNNILTEIFSNVHAK